MPQTDRIVEVTEWTTMRGARSWSERPLPPPQHGGRPILAIQWLVLVSFLFVENCSARRCDDTAGGNGVDSAAHCQLRCITAYCRTASPTSSRTPAADSDTGFVASDARTTACSTWSVFTENGFFAENECTCRNTAAAGDIVWCEDPRNYTVLAITCGAVALVSLGLVALCSRVSRNRRGRRVSIVEIQIQHAINRCIEEGRLPAHQPLQQRPPPDYNSSQQLWSRAASSMGRMTPEGSVDSSDDEGGQSTLPPPAFSASPAHTRRVLSRVAAYARMRQRASTDAHVPGDDLRRFASTHSDTHLQTIAHTTSTSEPELATAPGDAEAVTSAPLTRAVGVAPHAPPMRSAELRDHPLLPPLRSNSSLENGN
eukprot:m.239664 g.239664  ORF g.239664 m.239664 type:complete len:370 (+) comp26264_c0_seq1:164-1273(+)